MFALDLPTILQRKARVNEAQAYEFPEEYLSRWRERVQITEEKFITDVRPFAAADLVSAHAADLEKFYKECEMRWLNWFARNYA